MAPTIYNNAGGAFGAFQGIRSGTAAGKASGALQATRLGATNGLFGSNSGGVVGASNTGLNALGVYNGLKQGGVAGYAQAANSAYGLASGTSGIPGVGAALGTYNFVKNYQSGDTGGDALRGAEAGASIGSMIVPGVGTLVGGLIGGAVGAISSAFGNGKVDPENAGFEAYTQAYNKAPAGQKDQIAASVPNPYGVMAGYFDLRSNQLKGQNPLYTKYGRMGEQKFTNDLVNQINTAAKNGTINQGTSAQDVYSKVVAPWVDSMGSWNDSNKQALQGTIQQMTSQYISGQAQQQWKGQKGDAAFPQLPSFSAVAQPAPPGQVQPNSAATAQQNPFQSLGATPNNPQYAGQGEIGNFGGTGNLPTFSSPGSSAPGQQAQQPQGSSGVKPNLLAGLGAGALGAGVLGSLGGSGSPASGSNNNMNDQSGYGGNLGSLLGPLAGIAGSLYGNSQSTAGGNRATQLASLQGAGINTTGGSVSATAGPGGVQYNTSSPLSGQFNQFANLAGSYGQNALQGSVGNNPINALPGQVQGALGNVQQQVGGPNIQGAAGANYLGAGQGVLNQFNNFDPQAFAQKQYQNLAALAAPGETDQTQQMLNYEQASGRNGLTQNGQLGDLGGLNLSQKLADQNRQLQAQQLATQQQQSLGGLASGLSSTGNSLIGSGQQAALNNFTAAQQALSAGQGLNTSNLNNSLNATQGATGINQSLLQLLQTAIGGQQAQANAGANAGKYQYYNGAQTGATTGNIFGSLGSALGNYFGSSGGGGNSGGGGGSSYNPQAGWGQNGNSNQFSNVPSYESPIYNTQENYGSSGDTTYFGD